ncbi:hypothetical protein [Roseomonas nitratireducens]|uniref:hypothetical protein n=1 Tax=Roseomonas nitratireducens TaxID=2820810 RepID=UPI001ADEE68D|nr:hypothetical protein [Neoroseomonas nitratireducens]
MASQRGHTQVGIQVASRKSKASAAPRRQAVRKSRSCSPFTTIAPDDLTGSALGDVTMAARLMPRTIARLGGAQR